ncbi:MAG: hypothetical protein V5A62_17210 [Haloarculaceae archaeon]
MKDDTSNDVFLSLGGAGTEVNEEPSVGGNQVQRQRGANVGLVERETVAPVAEVNGYDYPAAEDVLRVTITAGGMDEEESEGTDGADGGGEDDGMEG